MTRKDTIIISVLVNAGLLLVLFISALSTKDNVGIQQSMEVASAILEENPDGMRSPLYNGNIVDDVKDHTNMSFPYEPLNDEKSELIKSDLTKSEQKKEEDKQIVHKLPEIVKSEKLKSDNEKKEKFIEVIVKKGDTLEKIAKRNNVSIAIIRNVNNLSGSLLKEGQGLLIPVVDNEKPVAKELLNENKEKIYPQAEYYIVKCGDNPWTIAIKHHLKVSELIRLNNLNNEKAKKLRPGDRLRIR